MAKEVLTTISFNAIFLYFGTIAVRTIYFYLNVTRSAKLLHPSIGRAYQCLPTPVPDARRRNLPNQQVF